MAYEFSVEDIIATWQRLERGEPAPAGITEQDLRRMVTELQFRAESSTTTPGYSSIGLQRVADSLEAALPAFRRHREEYERKQAAMAQGGTLDALLRS
jgi:hypothetical protein